MIDDYLNKPNQKYLVKETFNKQISPVCSIKQSSHDDTTIPYRFVLLLIVAIYTYQFPKLHIFAHSNYIRDPVFVIKPGQKACFGWVFKAHYDGFSLGGLEDPLSNLGHNKCPTKSRAS